jgi:hypothetical protein
MRYICLIIISLAFATSCEKQDELPISIKSPIFSFFQGYCQTSKQDEHTTSDSLTITINDSIVNIIHYRTLNCVSIIESDAALDKFLLKIAETEFEGDAQCFCPFALQYSISGLVKGHYRLEIWSSDSILLQQGSFEILY